jgi:hypothetical protein
VRAKHKHAPGFTARWAFTHRHERGRINSDQTFLRHDSNEDSCVSLIFADVSLMASGCLGSPILHLT